MGAAEEVARAAREPQPARAGALPCPRAPGGVRTLALPAVLVVGLELAPEVRLGLVGDADIAHQRLDLVHRPVEETLEALRIRPLVDGHDLAVRPVETMGDEPVLLRLPDDLLHPIRVLAGDLLELLRISLDPNGHYHRHSVLLRRSVAGRRPALAGRYSLGPYGVSALT